MRLHKSDRSPFHRVAKAEVRLFSTLVVHTELSSTDAKLQNFTAIELLAVKTNQALTKVVDHMTNTATHHFLQRFQKLPTAFITTQCHSTCHIPEYSGILGFADFNRTMKQEVQHWWGFI